MVTEFEQVEIYLWAKNSRRGSPELVSHLCPNTSQRAKAALSFSSIIPTPWPYPRSLGLCGSVTYIFQQAKWKNTQERKRSDVPNCLFRKVVIKTFAHQAYSGLCFQKKKKNRDLCLLISIFRPFTFSKVLVCWVCCFIFCFLCDLGLSLSFSFSSILLVDYMIIFREFHFDSFIVFLNVSFCMFFLVVSLDIAYYIYYA